MNVPELTFIRKITNITKTKQNRAALKSIRFILGTFFYYLILLCLSFVFLYPLIYMFSKSMMRIQDVSDATVVWIPKKLDFSNFVEGFKAIQFWKGFTNSMINSFGSAIIQIMSCSFIGYGFARYRFPGYVVWTALLVFTFLVPPQTIVVPLFMFFSDLGWINTHYPFIVPAVFGHGLRGALFVLIFIQFYRKLPHVFEEAARIDGAGPFRTYWQIMFPLAKPAMLVVFLFSAVWHWNDTFEPNLYLLVPEYFNLSQLMAIFNGNASANVMQVSQQLSAADAIGLAPTLINQIMAAVILSISPIIILYLFTQKYFTESVERSGIAGE
jgi:multiple sugar transport system permease protein